MMVTLHGSMTQKLYTALYLLSTIYCPLYSVDIPVSAVLV